MRYFAKIEKNNLVSRTVLVADEVVNPTGFLRNVLGEPGQWVETFVGGGAKKNFATIGAFYDSTANVFHGLQHYENFVFDEETATYIPPIPNPNDGLEYNWNHEVDDWALVEEGNNETEALA